jgi:MerR family redox-sensitive transcriptional activator SoxR
METFGIGEIARRAGVAASTIRYYEGIGLLPPAKRLNTKRRYDLSILEKINVIKMAQQAGLSIAEIQTLLHDFPVDTPPSERWETLAVKKIVELDAVIQQAQAMKSLLQQTLQCQCATIEDCATTRENADTGEITLEAGCIFYG